MASHRQHLSYMEFMEGEVTFDELVDRELDNARRAFPSNFHSAHEGYAILLEEVDELWTEVKVKQGKRDPAKMLAETVQIAAMVRRFAEDIVLDGKVQN